MTWRGTVLLLILAGLFLGFLFLSGRNRTLSPNETLLEFDPADVSKIIVQEGGNSLTLLKKNGEWFIQGKLSDRADPRAVATLLQTAASITPLDELKQADLKGATSLTALDLQTPKRSLTIEDGKSHTLWIGVDGAAKGSVYTRLDSGCDVFLIPGEISGMAFQAPEQFRDSRLTSTMFDRLEEVVLSKGSTLQQLQLRKGAQGWNIEGPIVARGDQQAISAWLKHLLSSRITAWMPPDTDPASCGMDSPSVILSLREQGGTQPLTITVGSPVPRTTAEYYIRCSDRPGICTVAGIGPDLSVTPLSLRSHQLKHVDYDSIDRIEIKDGTGILALKRKSGSDDWILADNNANSGTPLAEKKVKEWFEKLQGISASSFEPATPENLKIRGLEQPTLVRLIAHLSENTAEEKAGEMIVAEYALGTPANGEVALREGDCSDLMIVPEGILKLAEGNGLKQ